MSYTWGSAAADGVISNATIGASGSATSNAVTNSGFAVTECGLIFTYNGAATKGLKVEVLRTNDGGGNYQVDADSPFGFNMPFTAGATMRYVFSVPGTVSQFKINVINLDTGQSATAVTLDIRQATN